MRRALLLSAIGVSIGFSSSANSKTTNFQCTANGVTHPYRVTADEEKGEVTYEVTGNGNIFKRPAIFTADSVIWSGSSSSPSNRTQFTLSRVDLSFSVDVFIGGEVITPRKGKCEILVPPKRAF